MSEFIPSDSSERPVCVAIAICNEVIEDKWTGNKSLIGLFSNIGATQLPAQHARMFIMVSLTDGRGEWPILIRIESPAGKEIFKAEGSLKFEDPLAVHDLVVEVRGLPLPSAGEYHVGLICGGRPLSSRRFTVVLHTEEHKPTRH